MKYQVILFLLIVVTACSDISEPVVTFHDDNVLLPKVSFTSNEQGDFTVEYWPVSEKEARQKSSASTGVSHEVLLYNMTPATKYNYVVRNTADGNSSDTYEFTTAALPDDLITINKAKIDSTVFNGYILIRKIAAPAADILLNNRGYVVWYHRYDTSVGRAFFWTNRNSVLSTYDTSRMMDVNLAGERLLDIDVRERLPELNIHHEILYDKDGNIITITTDCLPEGQEQIKAFKGIGVCGDGIIRLKPDGTPAWKWSILSDPDLKLLEGQKLRGKEPIGHANAIAIADDGNYLVSMRDFSQVWKINSTTGVVMWKLGKGGDFKMPEESYFLRQHSIHFNQNGELMMYDNGEKPHRPLSRIISFHLDEAKMEAVPRVMIELSKQLSSSKMCSVYNITDDKFLVCTSRNNLTVSVVDKEGSVLWRIDADKSSYRAYYIDNPFRQE